MSVYPVNNAIILAAGFGSRFVPVTYELPKGLVSVKGEPLLERQIRQLLDKGITEIIIVVGYLKDAFNYLIDKFGVKLVFNPEYNIRNNLASLYYSQKYLKNTYILSADNWIKDNMFNAAEDQSWYSCVYKEGPTDEWCVFADDSGRISSVTIGGSDSWVMQGPVFFSRPFSDIFKKVIRDYYHKPGKEQYFWEQALMDELDRFELYINKQNRDNVYEFDTVEELRKFDPCYRGGPASDSLMKTIETVFTVKEQRIVDIKNYDAGMTNRSFGFSVKNKAYIFRLPGEGTENLINRTQEAEVYDAIKPLNISDKIIHFDRAKGYKISRFYENSRNTNAHIPDDVEKSMAILRIIHQSGIQVAHSFQIGAEIKRYLDLCNERNAIHYKDNAQVLRNMEMLLDHARKMNIPDVLCHIDSNPDNFIRLPDGTVKLVDWEYSGMADPIIDISMYSIYSYYSKSQMDELLAVYLQRKPARDEFARLYIYAALGGYLWALWTEYKQSYGVEFGAYGKKMYQYAKNNFKHLQRGFL